MITQSRKAVDEDGRLCFVLLFSLLIKTDSFIHYLFCEKQLRLHICCSPDPQQSLRLFIGPVATSHLREQFSNARNSAMAYAFAYALNCGHTPTKSYSVGGLVNPDSFGVRSEDAIQSGLKC